MTSRVRVPVLAALLLLPSGARAQRAPAAPEGNAPAATLVVTQLPAEPAAQGKPLAGGTLRASLGDGGRIVVVPPSGPPRVLSAGLSSAADPDVSFDGTRVVFAGRKLATDPWCLWEVHADGTGLRQVTCGKGDCRQPVYLSTVHTITATSTEPWVQVAFAGTSGDEANEAGAGPSSAIWSVKLDGTALRRLTWNLSNDGDPVVLPDGRIVYASWQRHSLSRGPYGRVVLVGIHEDGMDPQIYSGDEGLRVKRTPAPTAGGLVVFVEADSVAGDGGGSLARVSQRRPLHSYRRITGEAEGLFRSPSPLPDGRVLVSFRPAGGEGTYGVYRLDPETGAREKAFDDPAWHDVQARLLAPRPVPDGRSSVVRDDDPLGKLYAIDVSISDLDPKVFPRGAAKRLRVLEGVPPRAGIASHPPLAVRRFLGEVPLEADGSFHVQVPANTPVQLQLVDDDGLSLRSSAWIWARNHANQGCVGCHEDPERTPPNRLAKALEAPAAVLDLPVALRRTVDFRHDVAPLLSARCLGCHGAGGAPPRLDGAPEGSAAGAPSADYEALLPAAVVPGEARRSPLVWHLLGRNTSRPWDGEDARKAFRAMPGGDPLSAEEKRTFIEWIDLGALWDAGAGGGR
ncbi:MAG: hypothetical protein EDX89_02180 [Acidobacteria bacterium]|nr:MAG: hypothetical protein EDX89_02180 [Acidobacteriota bacterium]